MKKIYLVSLFLFTFFQLQAQIVYVNSQATSGANDGSSWANAYTDLQEAINNAPTGGQVWVAWAGETPYTPTSDVLNSQSPADDRNKTFRMRNNLEIYGGFAGNETTLTDRDFRNNKTILSGDIGSKGDITDNCYHVLNNSQNYLGATAVLDGFYIQHGNAKGAPVQNGGGMLNSQSSPIVRNCVFTGNIAIKGGAMADQETTAQIENCIFSDNIAENSAGDSYGGAVWSSYSNSTFTGCLFAANQADFGGAIYNTNSSLLSILNCTFSNNTAAVEGGGVNAVESALDIKNSIFWNNSSEIETSTATLNISHSIVQGGFTGTGNKNQNPLFVDPAGDYRLSQSSPAIDAGKPATTGLPASDLAGNNRVYNSVVDMGAYENTSFATYPCWDGTMATNTTWSDTIRIRDCGGGGNVFVPPGVKLTILPGTVVLFEGPYSIEVQGQLYAVGTSDEVIQFTKQDTTLLSDMAHPDDGGWSGIHFSNNSTDSSHLKHCLVEYGKKAGSGADGAGGGIFIDAYNRLTIENTTIKNCHAYTGAAVYIKSASPTFRNDSIVNNTAYYDVSDGGSGSAFYLKFAQPHLEGNFIANNLAEENGTIFLNESNAAVIQNLIVNNSAAAGGALYIDSQSSPQITSNTIANNHATTNGAALYIQSGGTPSVRNTIFSENTSGFDSELYFEEAFSTPDFNYCLFAGGKQSFSGTVDFPERHNVLENPLFISPTGGSGNSYEASAANWTVSATSPCINTGTPDTTGLSIPPTDFDQKPRVLNAGDVEIIDIGAYEFSGTSEYFNVNRDITSPESFPALASTSDTIRIFSHMQVASSATLTLEAGAYVQMQGFFGISVQGALLATGTQSAKIWFTHKSPEFFDFYTTDSTGAWKGIDFESPPLPSSLKYCHFSYAKSNGTAENKGGAIYISDYSDLEIENCVFENNVATFGGALYLTNASPMVNNCFFKNNYAENGSALVFDSNSSGRVYNSLITNNESTNGTVYASSSSPQFINVTLSQNMASQGQTFYLTNSSPEIISCILYGNSAVPHLALADDHSDPPIFYSCIEGGTGGIDPQNAGNTYTGTFQRNIDFDPLFAEPSNSDYSLLSESPCINTAEPTGGSNPNSFDLAGNPRTWDEIPDMGAYEFQGTPDFYNFNRDVDSEQGFLSDKINRIYNGLQVMPGAAMNVESYATIEMQTADSIGVSGTLYASNALFTAPLGVAWNGIRFWGTNASVLEYCQIENAENILGGGIGIFSEASIELKALQILNCTAEKGGAAYISGSNVKIKNSALENNTATKNGGALAIVSASPLIVNTLMYENYATTDGGAVYCQSATPLFYNNTIAKNSASSNTSALQLTGSNIDMRNTIVWDNTGGISADASSTPLINYSLVQGGASGTGNLNTSPNFANSAENDFRLSAGSNCINAGTPDTTGLGIPSKDFDGNPRVSASRIDIGAYEYSSIYNRDSLALVALYHSTNGDNWTNTVNGNQPWLVGTLENWYGVTVVSGKIIGLKLPNNNLDGTLPDEIGDLADLETLNLSNNKIAGVIPVAFEGMQALQSLNLAYNKISGAVPYELNYLANLVSLKLNDNQIVDLPELNMFSLMEVTAENNKLTFEDIEPNVGFFPTFSYIPQAKVNEPQTVIIENGANLILTTQVNGSANKYRWLKNGSYISSPSTQGYYVIGNAQADSAGIYTCEVSSDYPGISSSFVLERHPIYVVTELGADSLALVDLYNQTDGANWTDNSNWLVGNLSTWFGITINNRRVTQVNLPANNLKGELPTTIGNLNQVSTFNLSENSISGEIPAQISQMKNLTNLNLSSNLLNGSISAEFDHLVNLLVLNLSDNQLSGEIPSGLNSLPGLQSIELQNNAFSELGDMSSAVNLSYFNVSNNYLTFEDLEFNTSLPGNFVYAPQKKVNEPLTFELLIGDELEISTQVEGSANLYSWLQNGNYLTQNTPDSTYSIASATYQSAGVYHAEITNSLVPDLTLEREAIAIVVPDASSADSLILVELYDNTAGETWSDKANWKTGNLYDWFGIEVKGGRVTEISLGFNGLAGTLPWSIVNLEKLVKLELYNNELIGNLPSGFDKMPLRTLNLRNNAFSGSIPTDIGNAGMLVLNLANNQLQGSVPESLAALDELLILDVSQNDLTHLPDFSGSSLYNLQSLVVNNNQFTFEDISPNVGQFPSFTYSPQDSVEVEQKILLGYEGDTTISVSVGGKENFYEWFHNGSPVGSNQSTYTITNFSDTDVGTYLCEVSNPLAPALTISRRPVQVFLDPDAYYPVSQGDSLALIALYQSTNGGSWKTPWDTISSPVHSWHGVSVSGGRVTGLDLNTNSLSGTIAPEIGNLTNLKNCLLDYNEIGGEIPAQIQTIDSLRVLSLSENSLQGEIPAEIGNLDSLEFLQLGSNQLTGSIPSEIGNLSNLEYLMLNQNALSGSLPSELGSLEKLNLLDLSQNQFSGNILAGLFALPKLEYLWLNQNEFSGGIPTQVGQAVKLTYLDLSENQLSGSIPAEIGYLLALQHLLLKSNSFEGTVPESFSNLANLYELDVSQNLLEGSFPLVVTNLLNLEILNLSGNSFSGSLPAAIGNLNKLRNFNISNNFFEGSLPSELSLCSMLERVELYNNEFSGSLPPNIFPFRLNLLNLSNNNFSGAVPQSLQECFLLYNLNLSNNQFSGSIPDMSVSQNLIIMEMSNNNFTRLPDFRGAQLSTLQILSVDNNALTFEDIQPNTNLFSGFSYSPQDSINEKQTMIVFEGRDTTLTVENSFDVIIGQDTIVKNLGGDGNWYSWTRDGEVISESSSNTLSLTNFSNDDEGIYLCQVTTPSVPNLTILRRPIEVIKDTIPDNPIVDPLEPYCIGDNEITLTNKNGNENTFWYDDAQLTELLWQGRSLRITIEADRDTIYVVNRIGIRSSDTIPIPIVIRPGISYENETLVATYEENAEYQWFLYEDYIGSGQSYFPTQDGIYKVTLIKDGCSATSFPVELTNGEITVLGIEQFQALGRLALFPNPNSGIFTLELQSPLRGKVQLEIFAASGTTVTQQTLFKTTGLLSKQIVAQELPPGIYLIKLSANGKYSTIRMMKK